MRVFLIGATGGVGSRLARVLSAHGDDVTGLHRSEGQAEAVAALGATPVLGELIADEVDALAQKMTGHDAVVFSAGAAGTGMERTTLIDGDGVGKAAAAAERAGVRSFVLVSAFPEAERHRMLSPSEAHYMATKKRADVELVQTNLDWLIVRPGHLTNGPGTGAVTASIASVDGAVSRDNVAAFIAQSLHEPRLRRWIVELTDGSTPIAVAVEQLAEQRALRV